MSKERLRTSVDHGAEEKPGHSGGRRHSKDPDHPDKEHRDRPRATKFVAFGPGRQLPHGLEKDERRTSVDEKSKNEDPTRPYWEIELLKGAHHLRRHEMDFRKYKLRQRRIAEWVRRKSSIYITSGGDDLSLRSMGTIYDGPVPDDVSPALTLLNGIDKLILLPKELIHDAIMPWNSNISRYFVLMDATGHNRYRLEEVRHCCKKPELLIYDTFLHHKLGRIQRLGRTLKRKAGMDVYSPPTHFVGSVEQSWKCRPTFYVRDQYDALLFTIKLDKWVCCLRRADQMKINFTVRTPEGDEQGRIRADWDDLTYILFQDRKLYGVEFPVDMDVVHKLLLVTAEILVYYSVYEGKILKQVIHIHKEATKEYIEYQVLCGNDNDAGMDAISSVGSGSDTEVIQPLVDLENVR